MHGLVADALRDALVARGLVDVAVPARRVPEDEHGLLGGRHIGEDGATVVRERAPGGVVRSPPLRRHGTKHPDDLGAT